MTANPSDKELREQIAELIFDSRHMILHEDRVATIDEIMALIKEHSLQAEAYGRLHQIIELFRSGNLSADDYSRLHRQATDRIAQLQEERGKL